MISVSVKHRQGEFEIDAAFEAGGGVTALFGPSGSGKTTLVQVISGLTRPREATIRFDGTVWNDTAKGIFVPPHKRRIGYVFQEGRLFPHLTARQNLLYGHFFAPKDAGAMAEAEVVALLGIERLLSARPATLSGGEKQRVAIGRALLAAPRLILMDEPLSALDRSRKQEILPYIERIRDELRIPVIYVSHAIDEVSRLANSVVLLDEGRVKASGRPDVVFAGAFGMPESMVPQSILDGRLIGHEPYYGLSIAEVGSDIVTLQPVDLPEGTVVRMRIASTDIMLALERPDNISALNHLSGTITDMVPDGPHVLVSLDCSGQKLVSRITLLSAERLSLHKGLLVHALFKAVTVDSASVFHTSADGS
ncbi:molybdenum ABC transporter ATP-binding protein [Rhizobium sp. KVB221]|uniref:Molybdenum ABC transporter ATP-binding protein n=1 Tax=Rhizobium setariae TaxID=2801340 RepID=A0A936YQM6_9HYPH|nr:molybdenum ABC transporter ATP-binding protein [Rhizobium setariae]MBL0370782.1 molybdenum ABC transporter ATP-binding protein [Rhizobium setariae]